MFQGIDRGQLRLLGPETRIQLLFEGNVSHLGSTVGYHLAAAGFAYQTLHSENMT